MTVAELITALKKYNGTLPVRALDRGSDTRDWELFRIYGVEKGSVDSGGLSHPAVFVDVRP